ncbi:hypothetical protein ABZ605_17220 [Streptomyces sp. NPDC012765]|uniref:hypothetical protein n=1 Tax=Streptomyces sp. NPDC012765 TaxID=3155249 RepID=UPI0033CEC3B3
MRTALRTSLATAVLAGALLAPVAGTAYAATAPQTGPAASVSDSGHGGTRIDIAPGFAAMVRHTADGPEVEILALGKGEPDTFPTRSLGVLTPGSSSIWANGLELKLVKSGTAYVLTGTKEGTTTSWPLPKGQGPRCTSEPVSHDMGAGMLARLKMSPNGPIAQLESIPSTPETIKILDRETPSLPAGAGIVARILNASSAEPVFEWKTQGGNDWYGHATFPKLPKGCTFDYTFRAPTEKPQPDPAPKPKPEPSAEPSTKPSAKPSATAPAAARPQTAGQTTVVPEGGVAAGAERTAQDTDDTTTAYAGAGLAAVVAGLGVTFLARRRARTQR